MIKIILILLPIVTLVTGSVESDSGSDLPDDQVEQVLALYQKHCQPAYGQSSQSSSSSLGANVNIVCKEGREDREVPKKQIIRIPPGPQPKKNILFVEAPAYRVNHEINLVGDGASAPKTVVYVLPSKNSHKFNILDGRNGPTGSKPQVFFLKGNPSVSQYPQQPSQPIYGPPSQPQQNYGPPPSQPEQNYGPPPSQPQQNYGPPPSQPEQNYGQSVPEQTPVKVSYSQPIYNSPQNSLGPQYEVVQEAPPNTQNTYQNFYSQLQQPQIQVQQPQVLLNPSNDQGYSYQTQVVHQSQPQPQASNVQAYLSNPQQIVFQQESPNGPYEQDGRVIFPSESIQHQQYQFSPLEYQFQGQGQQPQYVQDQEQPVYETESPEVPESKEVESIHPSDMPRSITKRKLPSSEESFLDQQSSANSEEFEIGKDYIPNYNDYYNYMGFKKEYGLKSNPDQVDPEKKTKTSTKFSSDLIKESFKLFDLKSLTKFLERNQTKNSQSSFTEDKEEITTTTTNKPSKVLTSYTIAEDTNRKPLIAKESGFEIIPAALVSYSYSKSSNSNVNDAYGKET